MFYRTDDLVSLLWTFLQMYGILLLSGDINACNYVNVVDDPGLFCSRFVFFYICIRVLEVNERLSVSYLVPGMHVVVRHLGRRDYKEVYSVQCRHLSPCCRTTYRQLFRWYVMFQSSC